MSDPWLLDDPQPALDLWIEQDRPNDDLRIGLTEWLVAFDDPYVGERDPENPAAWAVVPFLLPPDRCVVVAYRIVPSERRIHVDVITELGWPL